MYTVSFSVLFRQKLWLASQCIIGTKASSSLDHTLDILVWKIQHWGYAFLYALFPFIFSAKNVSLLSMRNRGGFKERLALACRYEI